MNSRRDFRSHRAALFDGIEEGGIRAPVYSSREIHEQGNDQAMDSLHDRVSILKRLTGDIHEEVENHNRMLDRMGNDMDASRGFLSGTVDKFKMVFETKSSRRMATMVASFIAVFILIYYLTKALVLKRKEALADCEVMFCCHLICQCLLLHGWVTLVGGYAAFLYQIVWIFVYMCALLLGIRIYGWASARDAACRWTPLQCCLIDGASGRGANVKCDFCLSW
ncbi:bet1-like SNARE 1-1 isoform X2 [Panicum virgatum]|uniref:bet1-like SNARE 1-1 isoform X2 n=2 Tax=Panicum virgatum TaxID=38727 RepID=UPI0019D5BEBC|nr:bet1-like SNARE 1-1 isoform X2 [Panicum virgatum]